MRGEMKSPKIAFIRRWRSLIALDISSIIQTVLSYVNKMRDEYWYLGINCFWEYATENVCNLDFVMTKYIIGLKLSGSKWHIEFYLHIYVAVSMVKICSEQAPSHICDQCWFIV